MPSASTLCKLSRSRHRCTLIFLPKRICFIMPSPQWGNSAVILLVWQSNSWSVIVEKFSNLGKNIKVQRWRLRESLHRVDAEGIAQRRKGRLFHFTYTELVHPPINCAFRNGKKFWNFIYRKILIHITF